MATTRHLYSGLCRGIPYWGKIIQWYLG